MSDQKKFGDFCRSKRIESGLTLRKAAAVLAISPTYLSRIELGQMPPPAGDKLRKMAVLLSVPLNEMLELAESRASEVMASDPAGELARVFYMVTRDRSVTELDRALRVFVEALNLSQTQRESLKAALPSLFEQLQRAKEAEEIEHARMGLRKPSNGQLEFSFDQFDVRAKHLSSCEISEVAAAIWREFWRGESLGNAYPLDIEGLVESFADIRLIPDARLGQVGTEFENVDGLSRWSDDGKFREILIRESLYLNAGKEQDALFRYRYVLAHEFAHAQLHLPLISKEARGFRTDKRIANYTNDYHSKVASYFDTNDKLFEWQANEFGASLLMPKDSINADFFATWSAPLRFSSVEAATEYLAVSRPSLWRESVRCFPEKYGVSAKDMAIRLVSLGLINLPKKHLNN